MTVQWWEILLIVGGLLTLGFVCGFALWVYWIVIESKEQ